MAEEKDIRKGLQYCIQNLLDNIIIKTNSLEMVNIIIKLERFLGVLVWRLILFIRLARSSQLEYNNAPYGKEILFLIFLLA